MTAAQELEERSGAGIDSPAARADVVPSKRQTGAILPFPGRFIGTDPLLAGAVLASIEKRSPPESADLTVHIWSEAGDTSRGHASAGNTPDASTANNKRI